MDDVRAISMFGKKRYSDLFPNISLLDEKDFFILFDYFTLHLPIAGNWRQDRTLNLFEESVLRMLGIGNYDRDALVENLCLPPDLVRFILLTLESKGYITNTKTIARKGSAYIDGALASTDAALTPVYVLVRRDSGEILPMLFPRETLLKTALFDRDSKRVVVTIGSAGNEETFRYRYITYKASYQRKNLTQAEIRSIIIRHNNSSDLPIYISKDTHIEYSFEGSIFVHAKFILQDGYIDNLLSSLGCSYHSLWVLEYALKGYPGLRAQIKQDAVSHMESNGNKKRKKISGRYGMLRKHLNAVSVHGDYANIDERNENRANDAQTIRNLSAAVEWALAFHVREIGIPDTLVLTMKAQTPQQNGIMLQDMAKLAGLPDVNKHKNLFSYVSYANFVAWQGGGEPSLAFLLPIAGGIARRRSDSMLIPAILALGKHEAAGVGLALIARLSDYGKAARHGEKLVLTAGDTVSGLKSAILEFVNTLLPDYYDTEQDVTKHDNFDSASQRKLNAEVKVIESMGDFVFYGLPEDIRHLLLESVRLAESEDAVATITTLSSVLEKEFFYKFNLQKGEPNLRCVLERLRQRNALPKGLANVSLTYYKNAVYGKKSTLGASFLAWIGSLDDGHLDAVVEKNISSLVNNLVGMRGHGAGSLGVDMDDVRTIHMDVFRVVKWLEEN